MTPGSEISDPVERCRNSSSNRSRIRQPHEQRARRQHGRPVAGAAPQRRQQRELVAPRLEGRRDALVRGERRRGSVEDALHAARGEIADQALGLLLVRDHDRQRPLEVSRERREQDRGQCADAPRHDQAVFSPADPGEQVRVRGKAAGEVREHWVIPGRGVYRTPDSPWSCPEQPVHARQVLEVVAGQVVNEGPQAQGPVLRERAPALELLRRDALEPAQRGRPRGAERREGLPGIGVVVARAGGELVAVERRERRPVFREHALDADVVAQSLDVADVAHLPERREALTRNPFPEAGVQVRRVSGTSRERRLQPVGHRRETGEGRARERHYRALASGDFSRRRATALTAVSTA